MNEIIIENNEFLRQFEVKVSDSLARIEYAEQERKIFLTKIHIPDTVNDKLFDTTISLLPLTISVKSFDMFKL